MAEKYTEETDTITKLTWISHEWTDFISDDESQSCDKYALNNNSDNAGITVKIHVRGKLKAGNSASGPNCPVNGYFCSDCTDIR